MLATNKFESFCASTVRFKWNGHNSRYVWSRSINCRQLFNLLQWNCFANRIWPKFNIRLITKFISQSWMSFCLNFFVQFFGNALYSCMRLCLFGRYIVNFLCSDQEHASIHMNSIVSNFIRMKMPTKGNGKTINQKWYERWRQNCDSSFNKCLRFIIRIFRGIQWIHCSTSCVQFHGGFVRSNFGASIQFGGKWKKSFISSYIMVSIALSNIRKQSV